MLTISGDQFLFNNRPFRILSGAMHYFRVPPENWADRLRKLQAMGLNTVETYVAWNLHEPRPGEFHFEGILALERYLNLAAEIGLKAIVRPRPIYLFGMGLRRAAGLAAARPGHARALRLSTLPGSSRPILRRTTAAPCAAASLARGTGDRGAGRK